MLDFLISWTFGFAGRSMNFMSVQECIVLKRRDMNIRRRVEGLWPLLWIFALLFVSSETVLWAAEPITKRVRLEQITTGLDEPVGLANAGDDSGRLFIVERQGTILIFENGNTKPDAFLEIRDRVGSAGGEQGLLGLAFHPNYDTNGFFFVNYTDLEDNTKVSRFSVSSNPNLADPNSEVVILSINQPARNHNGGHLAFGPEGYLYIGTGDGGGAGDPFGNGQNGLTLLGAMLRLDVNRGLPYSIPPDNPYRGDPTVLDEIWALGLRNPWRYSFDRQTGDLYIADVGQSDYEEVNLQLASSTGKENYGWNIMEGSHCYPPGSTCDPSGLTLPIYEYTHGEGCSVTGGYVYRGEAFPAMAGVYVFGDYCSGRMWGLFSTSGGSRRSVELGQFNVRITSFGEDEDGELYLVHKGSGSGNGVLYKIRFKGITAIFPLLLND
jgi:glucose/arabinose dehydrogenase